MAIEPNGRFTPNATKAALELFSVTDMTRALSKLDCSLNREQIAQIASAYEQLFTPATVRRSERGVVRERLMKNVQDVFASTKQLQSTAAACEVLYDQVLAVRDDDWPGLYVKLALALGMQPDAAECAHAVLRLRREQGKSGEDACFASEQFDEMWSKSDRSAMDATREFESVLRDVVKTCLAAARKGALEGFKAIAEQDRRALQRDRVPHRSGQSDVRGRTARGR